MNDRCESTLSQTYLDASRAVYELVCRNHGICFYRHDSPILLNVIDGVNGVHVALCVFHDIECHPSGVLIINIIAMALLLSQDTVYSTPHTIYTRHTHSLSVMIYCMFGGSSGKEEVQVWF